MDEEKFEEIILGERKFLHDVSNSLVVAQGMSGFLLKAIQKYEGMGEKEIERMEKIVASVRKISELVQSRRKVLHENSSDKQ